MCQCTPEIRAPFCGKGDCVWPISGEARPSPLDMLMDRPEPIAPDGSSTWYAVSNPKAVRSQPMALFRTQADAQSVGGRMTLGEIEIVPVRITLPQEMVKVDLPMPRVTIITNP